MSRFECAILRIIRPSLPKKFTRPGFRPPGFRPEISTGLRLHAGRKEPQHGRGRRLELDRLMLRDHVPAEPADVQAGTVQRQRWINALTREPSCWRASTI